MLKGETIICFSSKDWVSYSRTSKEYLMEILSRDNHVLYIETTGSRNAQVSRRDFSRIWKRLVKGLRGPQKPEGLSKDQDLMVYSPLVIPKIDNPGILKFNNFLLRFVLKSWIRQKKGSKPILWYYLPTAVDLIGSLDEKGVIYHSVDEWSTYPGFRGAVFQERDEKLYRKADIVFATNRLLLEKKKSFNSNIHFMPHGVNIEDFEKSDDQSVEAEKLAGIAHPILAMIGGISGWTDWGLLAQLAQNHPEWSIVLMGDVGQDADVSKVKGATNIHFLGKVPYQELQCYYREIDVCIVSFLLTEHIKYCCPTRFMEHLANGKPVVSTDFPAAHEYGAELVSVAKDAKEFESHIQRALKENSPDKVEKRKAWAKANTWKSRAEKMSGLISRELSS